MCSPVGEKLEMKLRTMLFTLALLAFFSASVGGLIVYHSLKPLPSREMTHLANANEISVSFLAPLLGSSGYVVLVLCLLVGGAVLLFYRIASDDIVQRKMTEEALRESEEKFRAISGTAADAIILTDNDGKISYWNPAAERMFGYTQEEAVQQELHILLVPEEFHETYAEVLGERGEDDRVDTTAELIAVRKDETQFPIEVSTSTLNVKGDWHSVWIIRDISGRKLVEDKIKKLNEELEERVIERSAELFESEQRHRSLLEASADPIVVYDMEGKVTYLNPAFEQTFGWSLEELLGKRIDFVPEENRSETQQAIQRMREGEKVQLFETSRSTKDGRILVIQLSTSLFFDRDGNPAGNIVILRDVTESKQAEGALRKAHDDLELRVAQRTSELVKANEHLKLEVEERTRLATAIDQAAESVIISDRRGTIQYVNPAFERLSGFSQEDIVGENLHILKSDKHGEAFYKKMWETISRGQTWTGRINNRMKDGSLREFETSISPIRDGLGAIVSFVSVNRDVTQEVELEAQLLQAQKMEAVGTLAGGIAHDFNNLLQVIQGYSEVLLNGVSEDHSSYEPLEKILRSAKRGAELTRQLLTFSRKVPSEKRQLDLNYEVEQVQKLLERTIPKMIEIELCLTESPLFINGDPIQVEQAMMNLAVNAMDAMSDGGKIVIQTERVTLNKDSRNTHLEASPGTYALLSIADTGHGMSKETLEHVFEPFYTTKDVGKGTGLGLAMVYGIVKNHEGYIMCYTEPEIGTTFKIYLPSVEEERDSGDVGESEGRVPGGAETILLVDDEEYIIELGVELLSDAGYTVRAATDGESALEIYDKDLERIDLVILDLVIPGMGGKKCYEEILRLNPKAKILIVSGYPAEEARKEALEAGIRGFVGKPFDVVHMLKTVREILEQD